MAKLVVVDTSVGMGEANDGVAGGCCRAWARSCCVRAVERG